VSTVLEPPSPLSPDRRGAATALPGARPVSVDDLRLVPAALLTWAAVWWGTASAAGPTRWAAAWLLGVGVLGAGALAVAPLLARARRAPRQPGARVTAVRRTARRSPGDQLLAGVAVLVVACGCAGAALAVTSWQVERRQPEAVMTAAERSRLVDVALVVTGDPVTGQGVQPWQREQVRVRAVLERVHLDGATITARVPVSVSGDQGWAGVRWGQRLATEVVLEPAPAGAPYVLFARAGDRVAELSEPRWWWRAAERLRAGLLVAAGATAADPPDAAGLLPGLVLGDTSRQSPELVADMRTAGLTHLTAVSGANVSIICGGVLLSAVLLRLPSRAGAVLAAVALLALVVVARPEPSVLRAAVMGVVGLLGLLAGRRGGGVPALAGAVVVVLLLDPWLARAPGFRLSVLATGALVVLSLPWARALGRVLPRSVALVVAVPAAAQAAVTPALVGLDPVVSLYALPANVLAAPVVAPATVIGVLAALLSLLHPGLAALVAQPALWCATWIALVARTAADLPAASLPWPQGAGGALAAAAAALVLLAAVSLALRLLPDRRREGEGWAPWPARSAHRGRPAHPGRPAPRGRPALTVTVVVVVLALALWLLARAAGRIGGDDGAWPGHSWEVVVCDVGQGESLLVRAGPDSAVVVDTGPDPAPTRDCLRRAGVRAVPLLVLTHLHDDHVGGLPGVAEASTVAQLWTAPSGMPDGDVRQLEAWAQQAGVTVHRPVAGTLVQVGSLLVEVVAPTADRARPGGGARGSQDVNDAGLVLRLTTAGGLRVLAVGDIGSDVQRRLLADPALLQADVTTVAHHGSADQLPGFYAAVGARVAVASAGRDNTYGHPDPRALASVGAAGTRVLSTAVHGDVALRPDLRGGPTGSGASGDALGPLRAEGSEDPGALEPGSRDPVGAGVAVRTTRRAPRCHPRVPA